MASARKKKNPAVEAALRNPLYCRTNGFLLGCFLGLIRYRFASDQFRVHRARMLQFFEEIELDVPLPATWKRYSVDADSLMQLVITRCHEPRRASLPVLKRAPTTLASAAQAIPDQRARRRYIVRVCSQSPLVWPALADNGQP